MCTRKVVSETLLMVANSLVDEAHDMSRMARLLERPGTKTMGLPGSLRLNSEINMLGADMIARVVKQLDQNNY